jgi:hypothetical protein
MVLQARLQERFEVALTTRGAVRRGEEWTCRCVWPDHEDRRPSCRINLGRGFYCHSCHRGGNLRRLAELLGVPWPVGRRYPVSAATRPSVVPLPPIGIDPAEWRRAWVDTVHLAKRQSAKLAPYVESWRVSEWLRSRHQIVVDAHSLAARWGDDDPRTWALLRRAALVATEAAALEADLDAVRI